MVLQKQLLIGQFTYPNFDGPGDDPYEGKTFSRTPMSNIWERKHKVIHHLPQSWWPMQEGRRWWRPRAAEEGTGRERGSWRGRIFHHTRPTPGSCSSRKTCPQLVVGWGRRGVSFPENRNKMLSFGTPCSQMSQQLEVGWGRKGLSFSENKKN